MELEGLEVANSGPGWSSEVFLFGVTCLTSCSTTVVRSPAWPCPPVKTGYLVGAVTWGSRCSRLSVSHLHRGVLLECLGRYYLSCTGWRRKAVSVIQRGGPDFWKKKWENRGNIVLTIKQYNYLHKRFSFDFEFPKWKDYFQFIIGKCRESILSKEVRKVRIHELFIYSQYYIQFKLKVPS